MSSTLLRQHHQLMQQQHCDPSQRWFFIEQWLYAVSSHDCEIESSSTEQGSTKPDLPPHLRPSKRRRRVDNDPAGPAMSTPLPSDRAQSPSKRMKLSYRSRDSGRYDDDEDADDLFLAATGVPIFDTNQTPRRNTTSAFVRNVPQLSPGASRPAAVASFASAPRTASSVASRTTTSTTASRARGTSPTKKTRGLIDLKTPIYHVPIDDNKKDQLPQDIRDLYVRVYAIMVEHEGIIPSEVRDEINATAVLPFGQSWFRKRGDTTTRSTAGREQQQQQSAAYALAELAALHTIRRSAWGCSNRAQSEAAWNSEVHTPLLRLALDGAAHVRHVLVTTAQIAKPFVPPMGDFAPAEYTDKKMVDLAMVLVPEPDGYEEEEAAQARQRGARLGGVGAGEAAQDEDEDEGKGAAAHRYHRLARAIRNMVRSQPLDRQTINQSTYTALTDRPIGISIETKAEGANDAGRVQLAIWTAAWHQRMKGIMAALGKLSHDTRLITLPLLLVVEHNWTLSFVCDKGDHLDIVGEMSIGETASLKGLYTLLAVLRELGKWVQGPFAEWMAGVLDDFADAS